MEELLARLRRDPAPFNGPGGTGSEIRPLAAGHASDAHFRCAALPSRYRRWNTAAGVS